MAQPRSVSPAASPWAPDRPQGAVARADAALPWACGAMVLSSALAATDTAPGRSLVVDLLPLAVGLVLIVATIVVAVGSPRARTPVPLPPLPSRGDDDDEDDDPGRGGGNVRREPHPPAGPSGPAMDWDAFDRERASWDARVPSGR